MSNNNNELFPSKYYGGKYAPFIKEIKAKFNVNDLFDPKLEFKDYYTKAKRIASQIPGSNYIKPEGSDSGNVVYFNSFMNAVSETFLLAWLLSFNPENNDPSQDYDQEFNNNKEFKEIVLTWPSYNKKSLQMCFCNLHNYIDNSKKLLNYHSSEFGKKFNKKFNEEFNKKLNEDLKKKLNEELKKKLNEELNEELKEELKKKLNEELNEELKKKLKEELKEELNKKLNEKLKNILWKYVPFEHLEKLRIRFSHGPIVKPGGKWYEDCPEINVFKCMQYQIVFSVHFLKTYFFEKI